MKKEIKAAPAGAEDALLRAFESFKQANDERLKAIERKGAMCCSKRRSIVSIGR